MRRVRGIGVSRAEGLQIPKLRQGTYFPDWLLEPRGAETALTAVVAEAYKQGVSTRRVEDLVQSLGIEKLSKSQVSLLSKDLDGVVQSFRERPLTGTFKYLCWAVVRRYMTIGRDEPEEEPKARKPALKKHAA
jgi:transposase-like protein